VRPYSTERGKFGTIMSFADFSGKTETGQNKIESSAFLIGVILCVLLSGFLAGSFFCVAGENCDAVLESRVNPNEASVPSLIRLPGIGRNRAESIVSYRNDLCAVNTECRAFRSCEDLEKVKGIGPKTAEGICGWLKFE